VKERARILVGFGLVGIAVFITVMASCDGDKPQEPAEPKDYPVYFHNGDSDSQYFAYHPLTGALDTFSLSVNLKWPMAVSPDGGRLYIPTAEAVAVIDAATRALVSELPYKARGGVAISPDNRYLAILGDDLYIVRTDDLETVHHDTDWASRGWFSDDSKSFYCASGGVSARAVAYKVRLDSSVTVTRRAFPDGNVGDIAPSPDESKWYIYLYVSCYAWFVVYDVDLDSVIHTQSLPYGMGSLTMSPDGHYVFYTHPGDFQCGIGPAQIWVFDADQNAVRQTIETYIVRGTGDTVSIPADHMVVTPDGRWLVANGFQGELGLITIDAKLLEVHETVHLPGVFIYSLACQNAP